MDRHTQNTLACSLKVTFSVTVLEKLGESAKTALSTVCLLCNLSGNVNYTPIFRLYKKDGVY